ncbi:hypothetical protein ACH5RR_002804 [Cinchona calisaya]|uniref:Uncharacterized protein n=1 Tax=Cinchona calisaya TaxID=153742 RepID=A0ABD3AT54_9GENT
MVEAKTMRRDEKDEGNRSELAVGKGDYNRDGEVEVRKVMAIGSLLKEKGSSGTGMIGKTIEDKPSCSNLNQDRDELRRKAISKDLIVRNEKEKEDPMMVDKIGKDQNEVG